MIQLKLLKTVHGNFLKCFQDWKSIPEHKNYA